MKTILVIVVLLLSCFPVAAQEHPAIAAQPNSVYVGADGKFETNPDTAYIHFNISAQENSARDAYEHASKSAEQIRQILRNNGLEPKAAQIGYYALQPVYDYRTPKRKIVGYRVTSNVDLKLKDFSKVGPILQQLAEADITEDQSVNYGLEDTEAAKTKAVEDAYRRARGTAAAIALASGRTLGELSYAAVDTYAPVRPVPMMARSAMATKAGALPAPTEEFTAQTVTVTAHVNAVFTLK